MVFYFRITISTCTFEFLLLIFEKFRKNEIRVQNKDLYKIFVLGMHREVDTLYTHVFISIYYAILTSSLNTYFSHITLSRRRVYPKNNNSGVIIVIVVILHIVRTNYTKLLLCNIENYNIDATKLTRKKNAVYKNM